MKEVFKQKWDLRAMCDAYARVPDDTDAHEYAASKALGIDVADVTREQRQCAKLLSFGSRG